MEYTLYDIAKAAGIFFGASGIGAYALKKNGYLTIGKAKERRQCVGQCTEHNTLAKEVRLNTLSIEKVERKVNRIDEKLDGVDSKVSEIAGFIRGRQGKF